jgi:WD40 repeat protein
VLRGHQAEVPALAFSADGRRLASASLDQSVRVWDVDSGAELYASPPQGPAALGKRNATVALTRDGTRLLVPIPFTGPQFTPEWKVGRVRDLTADKDVCTLQSPNLTQVTRFVFSPDGKQVAGVGESFQGRLRLWDAATGREIKNLPGNTSMVHDLAFSPDGKVIATIGDNANKGELKLWDLTTGKETFTFTADIFDQLAAVAFSPDGKYLVACGKSITPQVQGGTIRHKGIFKVWDVAKRELLKKLSELAEPSSSPVFSPDSRLLAATFAGNKARVFDLKSQEEILSMPGWGDVPYHQVLAFSPDSKRLALAGFYNVQVWDVAGKKQVHDLRGHSKQVLSVAFSPDGRRLASGGADHAVRIWDLKAAERPLALREGNRVFDQAVISPDGEFIATAGVEQVIGKKITCQIQLWKTATGEKVRGWEGHDDPIKGLAFSPDGKCLASASWQAVKLWNTATGDELRSFKGHDAQPFGALSGANAVAFSPDGKLVATTGNDGTLQLWKPESGEVVFRWHPESKEARFGRGLAFSRDGTRLAVGFQVGFRGEIKIFDATSRQVVCTIPHLIEPGGGKLALSPDGSRLAALHPLAAESNPQSLAEVHVWDAATGKHLFDLRGHATKIGGVSFSPDGKRLASASWDSTVKLWDLQTQKEVLNLRGPRGYAFGAAFSGDGNRLISTHSLYSGTGLSGSGEVRIWDARPLPPPKAPRPQR